MRRRLFWSFAGVAAVTGLVVLVGTVYASQRAAVEATQRELAQSSREIATIVEDAVTQTERGPGGMLELIRLLEGDQLRPILSRIRRAAGSSTLALAVIGPEGLRGGNAELFARLDLDEDLLESGENQFLRSTADELVVVTPVSLTTPGDLSVTLLIGLAREAPVVVLGDMGPGVVLIGIAVLALAGLLARILSRQIAKRLDPLSAASRDLADGDLSARVPDLGDPELDDVANAFNEMAEALESASDREREFLLGVGHDLRTPLTTIGGYAEALESGDLDSGEIGRIGGVITKQTGQLRRLIEDLTLLARLDQPEFDLRIEKVELIGHLTAIVESYRRKADEAGVGFSADLAGEIELDTDPDRVAQITQNLLENALRFTPEAGTVEVSAGRGADTVEIRVSDTGIGIDPDDLPRIFDRHFVGRRRQVRNEGSGLGLSIVKGLTGRLGGSVAAESTPGRGTTVTVALPD